MTHVLPRDISLEPQSDLVRAFAGYFGKYEMDAVARLIVTLLSIRNEWDSFTYEEILITARRPEEDESKNTVLEGLDFLVYHDWIERLPRDRFKVKEKFIKRCVEKTEEVRQKKSL